MRPQQTYVRLNAERCLDKASIGPQGWSTARNEFPIGRALSRRSSRRSSAIAFPANTRILANRCRRFAGLAIVARARRSARPAPAELGAKRRAPRASRLPKPRGKPWPNRWLELPRAPQFCSSMPQPVARTPRAGRMCWPHYEVARQGSPEGQFLLDRPPAVHIRPPRLRAASARLARPDSERMSFGLRAARIAPCAGCRIDLCLRHRANQEQAQAGERREQVDHDKGRAVVHETILNGRIRCGERARQSESSNRIRRAIPRPPPAEAHREAGRNSEQARGNSADA